MDITFNGMVPLLQVFDMPAALRFYRDILGFEVVNTSGGGDVSDWVWLRRGDVDLMLNTAYEADARPATPDPIRWSCHADTGLFWSPRKRHRTACDSSTSPILTATCCAFSGRRATTQELDNCHGSESADRKSTDPSRMQRTVSSRFGERRFQRQGRLRV